MYSFFFGVTLLVLVLLNNGKVHKKMIILAERLKISTNMTAYTHTNLSFDYLNSSPEFLKCLINNIRTCILILDKNMELQAFNAPLETIFGQKGSEELLLKKCGNVIGCAYAVEEEALCGTTSYCKYCSLRIDALEAYTNKENFSNRTLVREFYDVNGRKWEKHLKYAVSSFKYHDERYIMVLIDDFTDYLGETKKD